jgi:hypothetical protein
LSTRLGHSRNVGEEGADAEATVAAEGVDAEATVVEEEDAAAEAGEATTATGKRPPLILPVLDRAWFPHWKT